jgi:hypothetical protein
MAWEKYGDGLRLVRSPHFDKDKVLRLVSQLRTMYTRSRNICDQLEKVANHGTVSRAMVFQFSKWCHCRLGKGMEIAVEISKELFFGVVCRRFLTEQNVPVPNPEVASNDYQKWLVDVLSLSDGVAQEAVYPDEIDDNFVEGRVKQVRVNIYERNKDARRKCLEHYGDKCRICGFSFEDTYEGIGSGFIHVHHIVPIFTIGKEYSVNPVKDLIPVCPNCHAVIHKCKHPYSIDEVKAMLKGK